jgi:hypothetical protein
MKGIATLSFVLLLAVAGSANAAATYNESLKYFDENGNLVGQRITLCDNHAYHAGNTHTAYSIDEEIYCQGANDPNPPTPDYIVPGTRVVSYTLPGFLSIQQACSIAECTRADIPVIDRLLDKGWTWENF